jgi:glycosyltransferase involved in cell wall biosynthesis
MARIAYVAYAGSPSGGTRILAEHLNRLSDRGHDCVMFFLLENQRINWMRADFQQAHLNDVSLDHFDAVVATEINTWPIVFTYGNFPNADRRLVFMQMVEHRFWHHGSEEYEKYYRYYDLFESLRPVVISQWLYDWATKFSPFEPVIIPNGVNTDTFYPERFDGLDNRLRILIEGHGYNAAKDIADMSYRAAMWLKSEGVEFDLWGFSQYPQPHEYDRYWRLPSQDDIRRIYSSCDILLKASRFEGRSCVDVEAMACGCAVNRAILTGDDDLVDGFNCLKVAYGEHVGFLKNLLRLANDEALRGKLIDNGLAYVRGNLNWDDIIPGLEQALLGNGNTREDKERLGKVPKKRKRKR